MTGKRMRQMNTTNKVITGFVIGALAGTLIGLFAAPSSGKRTRRKLGKKSKKIARQVAGYLHLGDRAPARKNGKAEHA